MKDLGLKCRDVRTREVGITEIHEKVRPNDVELVRREYYANGGWETFLSYEDPEQDILIGLLRYLIYSFCVHIKWKFAGSESVRKQLTGRN